jgi:hypothetical protein
VQALSLMPPSVCSCGTRWPSTDDVYLVVAQMIGLGTVVDWKVCAVHVGRAYDQMRSSVEFS